MHVHPRSRSAAAAYPPSRDGSEGWSSAWSKGSTLPGWGDHEPSVWKLASRCSLPRSDSVVFRRRAQSSIGEACALMTHSHREVYMVDPIALMAKAANCTPALVHELVKRKRCSEGTVNMGDVLRVLKTDDELKRTREKEDSPSAIAPEENKEQVHEEESPPPELKELEEVSPTPPPRTPPPRPPFPFRLRKNPEEKMNAINVTQFIPERTGNENEDVLVKRTSLWSQTFSDDSLQWGEPCPPARRRRNAPVRFSAGSHGCLNLSQPSKSPVAFAKSIDNMHLSSFASRQDNAEKVTNHLATTPSPQGARKKEVRLVEPEQEEEINATCELSISPVAPPRTKPRRPPPPVLTASASDIDKLKDDPDLEPLSTLANKSPNLSTSSGLDISSDLSLEGMNHHKAKDFSRLSSSPDERYFEVYRMPTSSRRRRGLRRRKESPDEDCFMSTASTPSRQRPRRPPPPVLTVSDSNLFRDDSLSQDDSEEVIGRQTIRVSTLY